MLHRYLKFLLIKCFNNRTYKRMGTKKNNLFFVHKIVFLIIYDFVVKIRCEKLLPKLLSSPIISHSRFSYLGVIFISHKIVGYYFKPYPSSSHSASFIYSSNSTSNISLRIYNTQKKPILSCSCVKDGK